MSNLKKRTWLLGIVFLLLIQFLNIFNYEDKCVFFSCTLKNGRNVTIHIRLVTSRRLGVLTNWYQDKNAETRETMGVVSTRP